MCPSYLATRDEKDSTRGRARVLQEMVDRHARLAAGSPRRRRRARPLPVLQGLRHGLPDRRGHGDVQGGGAAPEVPPAGAARAATTRWAGCPHLVRQTPPAAGQRRAEARPAGRQGRRRASTAAAPLPALARRRQPAAGHEVESGHRDVVIWVDTFTDRFAPESRPLQQSRLLESTGQRVGVIGGDACCGLTWISTGQLDAGADRGSARLLHTSTSSDDVPVVGARAVVPRRAPRRRRSDLLGGRRSPTRGPWPSTSSPSAGRRPTCPARRSSPSRTATTPRCWAGRPTRRCCARPAPTVTRVGGCCGLAGNFGMEKGHYEVSVAVAEHALLPAVRAAAPDAVVLADGFSCRTQLADLAGARAVHLAAAARGPARLARTTADTVCSGIRVRSGPVLTPLWRPGSLVDRAWHTQAHARALKPSRVAAFAAFDPRLRP